MRHRPTSPFSAPFAEDADHDFEVRCVVGLASSGGADVGEVLAAVRDVPAKDEKAWAQAWRDLGARVAAHAKEAAAAGSSQTAAAASLRAANYLAVAVNAASACGDDGGVRELFGAHRAAWDVFAGNAPFPLRRVDVPLDGATMPGYLFLAAPDGTQRPTVVFVNGSDGSLSSQWSTGAAAALARGFNAFLFDGPGQQSMLFEQGVPFRPDWEAVLAPVLTALVDHPEVDADRLVVWGISQGGFWVTRALTVEHRFAAAVVDPGVIDVSQSWTQAMPHSLLELIDEGKDARFDSEMAMGMRFSSGLAALWRFRARPFGPGSYSEVLRRVQEYRLSPSDVSRIATPLLVTDPEGEQFWPGQSQRLADLLPGLTTLLPFTAAEGADLHCEPLARTLVHERVLDWLTGTLSRR